MKPLLLLLPAVIFAACSPRITANLSYDYDPLDSMEDVIVVEKEAPISEDAELLGTVKIDDTGYTVPWKGSYGAVIAYAKEKAREAGGNVVRITKHKVNEGRDSFHNIDAEVFRAGQVPDTLLVSLPIQSGVDRLEEKPREKWPQVRITAQVGGAYRVGRTMEGMEEVLKDHVEKLRPGFTYGADVNWFFLRGLGVGFRFHNLHVGDKQSVKVIVKGEDYERKVRYGYLEDRIVISFLGPIVTWRLLNRLNGNSFYISSGAGYVRFSDKAIMLDPYSIKGSTWGTVTEVGFNWGLSKHFNLGASLAYYSGVLSEFDYIDSIGNTRLVTLEKSEYESLNHFDLSMALRFVF